MKQVLLRPRDARAASATPLRSDTLFGLIALGVRMVHGKSAVEKMVEPMLGDPGRAALRLTSAFPFEQRADGIVYRFPRPRSSDGSSFARSPFIEDRQLLAFVSGRGVAEEAAEPAAIDAAGSFFLVAGPFEHLVDGAVRFLERFGFGGNAFEVEVREAEFLRLAEPGERGLLLSLHLPTLEERAAAAKADGAAWGVERRAGFFGGRLGGTPGMDARKRAVAMWTEGSLVPCVGAMGGAAVVGVDPVENHPIVQHGFGFLVPVAAGAAA